MTFSTDLLIVFFRLNVDTLPAFITAFVAITISTIGNIWFIVVREIFIGGVVPAFRNRGMGRVTPHDGHSARDWFAAIAGLFFATG